MIERQPRDHARQWAFNHVGGVKAAAKPDFEEQNIGLMAREQKKGRRGLHLENRDRRLAVFGLAFGKHIGEFVILDEPTAAFVRDAETLVEADQIGRGVNMHPLLCRLQDRAHERDGGAFAVGAGHMNEWRQTPFGMSEQSQEPFDAIEFQVDPLGMQRQ